MNIQIFRAEARDWERNGGRDIGFWRDPSAQVSATQFQCLGHCSLISDRNLSTLFAETADMRSNLINRPIDINVGIECNMAQIRINERKRNCRARHGGKGRSDSCCAKAVETIDAREVMRRSGPSLCLIL